MPRNLSTELGVWYFSIKLLGTGSCSGV